MHKSCDGCFALNSDKGRCYLLHEVEEHEAELVNGYRTLHYAPTGECEKPLTAREFVDVGRMRRQACKRTHAAVS